MLFWQMLMSGATRLLAPPNDDGSEFDDPDIDLDQDQDEPVEGDDDEDEVEEPDETEDLDEQDDEPPARQPTRGENRVAAATRAAAEAKAEAKALREAVARLEAAGRQPAQAVETPAQLQARLAEMEPWDRAVEIAQMTARNTQAQLDQMRWQSQEANDRVAYDALAARVPAAAKYRQDVEDRLAEMRAQGTTAPRETVLRWVIGDKALANATKATSKAQRSADANRQRNTTRPSNGRGDTPPSNDRGNSASALEKRLANVQL